MSMKRTLLSGLVLAPLCLVLPGTASAADGRGEPLPLTTGWWPGHSSSEEESAVFAGIGGAGVLHRESGVDEWGNRWSEHDGSLAGIGGAAVLHGSQETSGVTAWPAHDTLRSQDVTPASPVVHAAAPAAASAPEAPAAPKVAKAPEAAKAAAPVKAAPVPQAKKAAGRTPEAVPVRTLGHPTDDSESSYHAGATSAGPEGATSAQVNSHAGRDHAWYSASALSAGPDGAASAGIAALSIPGAAGYRAWEVGAGPAGAYSHSTSAAADVRDSDLD
ncbi:hypothetical protein [Amycolatopsis sp. GA6-003]|uniref:hypothetical protein n=1 Tax=Amycolatopsis sp. GA6-003 TaxID=2652444 RepID=UPI0039172148